MIEENITISTRKYKVWFVVSLAVKVPEFHVRVLGLIPGSGGEGVTAGTSGLLLPKGGS